MIKKICKNIAAYITLVAMIIQPIAPVLANPQTEAAANGVPIVQINNPNKNGISYNPFDKFNVNQNGLIFNNSQQIVNTQLAGYIMGNKNLANGPARLILAEVLGNTPSRLNGYMEIAGQKAGLIIANPNGIIGNGFGFINANKVTLTTGKPIFAENGDLSYSITQGNVQINGKGLDAAQTDKIDILAKAVQINAGIWANDLSVTTGTNKIDQNGKIEETANEKNTPEMQQQFALDIGALGGMYAGKIKLIGTEKGLGVNNQGTIKANQDFILQTNGSLIQQGKILAGQNAQIEAGQIENQGTIYAQQNAQITLQNQIQNQGTISAGKTLNIKGQNIQNNQGGTISAKQLDIKAKTINADQSIIYADENLKLKAEEQIDLNQAQIQTQGALEIEAKNKIKNKNGQIQAEKIGITTNTLENNNGKLIQYGKEDLNLTITEKIENQGGTIAANSQNINIQTKQMDNTQGIILHAGEGTLSIKSQNIQNSQGQIAAQKDLQITADTIKNNQNGKITANQAISLKARALQNNQGQIAAGNVQIKNTELNNGQGKIYAQKTVEIQAQTLEQTGNIQAEEQINLKLENSYTQETESTLKANGSLKLETKGDIINKGQIEAVQNLNLSGQTIENQGKITANNKTELKAQEAVKNEGTINGGYIEIAGKTIKNTGGIIGGGLQTQSETLQNTGEKAILAAAEGMNLLAKDKLVNEDQANIYTLGNLCIAGGQNQEKTRQIINQSAQIEAGKDIYILAEELTNKRTIFETGQKETIYPGYKYENLPFTNNPNDDTYIEKARRWYIEKTYETTIEKDTGAARIVGGQDIIISAEKLTNHTSEISAGKNLDIKAGKLENISPAFYKKTIKQGKDEYTIKEKGHYVGGNGGNGTGGESGGGGGGRSAIKARAADWVEGKTTTETYDYYSEKTEQIQGSIAILQGNQNVNISAKNIQNAITNKEQTGTTLPGSQTQTQLQTMQQTAQTNQQKNKEQISCKLPQSALFTIHNEPESHYLVETDKRFTDYKTFISSDYLIGKLGYDPAKAMKRLGDGFYEQKLIKDQIAGKTGSQTLEDYQNAEEQYKALMENAAEEAKDLQLSIGITLTKEQIAALKKDIVWMEEKEIEGHKVLVPVVYLTEASQYKINKNGSLITGGSINLEAENEIKNQGAVTAKQNIQIKAQNITNQGGKIQTQGNINLKANQNINNINAQIKGNNINLEAGQNITNETAVKTINYGQNQTVLIGEKAKIEAEGNINITAGQNIKNKGAQIKGNEINLEAGQNIQITTLETKTKDERKKETNQTQSQINAKQNININAQNDIQIESGKIKAGEKITLGAGNNINITAAKETMDKKGNGELVGKTDKQTSITNKNSQIEAGKDLIITAGKDIKAQAAKLNAGENIAIKGGGQINLTAAEDTYTADKQKTNNRWYKKDSQSTQQTKNNTTGLNAGKDIIIIGEKDMNLKAVQARAEGEINLEAKGNINLEAEKTQKKTKATKPSKEAGKNKTPKTNTP